MKTEMFKVDILLDDAWIDDRGPYGNIGEARRIRSILKGQLKKGNVLGIPVQDYEGRIKIRIAMATWSPSVGVRGTPWKQIEGDI